MKNSTRIAVCSVVTAMSVVLLFLGGITFVLAYAMPMLVGVFMIMLKRTFSASSAWITFTATSVLAFMLVADKECSLMYIVLFGYYPIIVSAFDKIKNKALQMIVKLLFFNTMFALCQIILFYAFGIPFLEEGEGKYIIILFALMMNFLFIIYDKLVGVLNILYAKKIEKRIKKLFK